MVSPQSLSEIAAKFGVVHRQKKKKKKTNYGDLMWERGGGRRHNTWTKLG
jgi:hypothetical protein